MVSLTQSDGIRRGFTLVEILIVVVTLGILAAMVVPQFSTASEDAMESQLCSNVRLVRNQIELYRVQHDGRLPHLDENGKNSYAKAIDRLLNKTTASGKITESGSYGPYLDKWPANPFAEDALDEKIAIGKKTAPPRNNKSGWYYCYETGVVSANTTKGALDMDPDS